MRQADPKHPIDNLGNGFAESQNLFSRENGLQLVERGKGMLLDDFSLVFKRWVLHKKFDAALASSLASASPEAI